MNSMLIELLKAEDQQQLDEEGDSATTLEDKETSIDSDIMSSVSYEQTITESLAAQRARMQHVLRDMAKEISYLLGKDLSSESLSTFSELDATPLHYLIEDLKREIDAKDTLLQGKTESIVQLEERVTVREKELHRLKLRHDSASQERTSYEKRIEHLQEALREHDRTIEAFRQQNAILGQQLEDMSETLQTYKENLRRTVEEKNNAEDELEDQKHRHVALLKDEMKSLQAQMADFQREIASRQRDREYLTYFREKCAELEMEHQLELQRMRDEIESLSGQLAGYSETSVQHEQLLRESNTLQNTIQELQNHNDVLQKAIQSHEESIEQLQQELSTSKFQIGKLKGKNSNLEQSLFNKEELIERLQQNLRDLTQRLTAKSEIAQTMETRSVNLSQKLDKIREDSTAREKRLSEELNTIRRSSQDQQNQLQQCENQLAWHREELKELRGKAEAVLKERNSLRQQTSDLTSKLSIAAGKESALCEVLKQLQDELSTKTSRLAEVEDNYRKISHAYQNLRVFNEDLAKQNQAARVHLENYKALVEFKRQTINTVELGRKCAEESRARERLLEQKIAEQKRLIGQLCEDRVKLMDKLQDYHKDSLILNQTIEGYQQTYDDSRRNQNTSLHQPFYPSGAFRLVRSSSDPNCKEGDDLLRKLQLTRSRLHRTREFWQQGIKEILAPK